MPSKTRPITAEDLYDLQTISSVRLSPDGKRVIFSVQNVDRKSEKKYTHLWMAPTSGGAARPFTYGQHSNLAPRWSPDGSQVAFLSTRGGADKPAQIYLLPNDGGEARPLSDIDGEIDELVWSPDGKKLLCLVRKTDTEEQERQKDEQKKKLGVVARHYQRLFYKLDGYGYLPHERWHLWLVDAHSGKAKQLTDHPIYDEGSPAWSPDGKWIAFTSNRTPDPDMDTDEIDVYLMPAAGGEWRKLDLPPGTKNQLSFSPDGRWLAYYGVGHKNEWYRNEGLWVAALDGSTPARNLLEGHDLHASSGTINDVGSPENMAPTWSSDSQKLYFPVARHGSSLLMVIGRDGSGLQTLLGEQAVVGSFSFDARQEKMAYFYATSSDPGQVWLREMSSGQSRPLTQINRSLLDKLDLGTLEEVWFKGPDGNDLQGWILKPPGFDPQRKYPSIMEIHGGPLAQYGWYFMHEFYYFAAQGYVVYFCNPRGGRGYGEQHAGAIWGGWGGADYADLMAWADLMEKQPYIDPRRMGVTGGSYGGYMTVWIIGHTRRFKAAVTQRCVSNFVSMWGSSDFNWTFQQVLNDTAPFEDLQKFWEHSPIKYIGNAQTPTKVIHNEFDLRCPIEQGEQVFVALKRLGVPSEMVRFPDEPHGLSRIGRTDRRIARLNHILSWFEGYLKA